jgi:hypothetical protein
MFNAIPLVKAQRMLRYLSLVRGSANQDGAKFMPVYKHSVDTSVCIHWPNWRPT